MQSTVAISTRARQLKAQFPGLAEEVLTWSFWRQCLNQELRLEQIRELIDYLKVLRRLSL